MARELSPPPTPPPPPQPLRPLNRNPARQARGTRPPSGLAAGPAKPRARVRGILRRADLPNTLADARPCRDTRGEAHGAGLTWGAGGEPRGSPDCLALLCARASRSALSASPAAARPHPRSGERHETPAPRSGHLRIKRRFQVSSVSNELLWSSSDEWTPHALSNYSLKMRMREPRRRRPLLPEKSGALRRRPRLSPARPRLSPPPPLPERAGAPGGCAYPVLRCLRPRSSLRGAPSVMPTSGRACVLSRTPP